MFATEPLMKIIFALLHYTQGKSSRKCNPRQTCSCSINGMLIGYNWNSYTTPYKCLGDISQTDAKCYCVQLAVLLINTTHTFFLFTLKNSIWFELSKSKTSLSYNWCHKLYPWTITVTVLINDKKISVTWYAINDWHARRKVKSLKSISCLHYSRQN